MKKIKRVTAKDQVLNMLREEIFNGDLKSGQEITQEEIANLFGVSRMPVREALQELDREGLIRIDNNRRVTVVGFNTSEIHMHYEIRALLEGLAAYHAALNTDFHQELENIHKEMVDSIETKDRQYYVELNEKFHQTIWEASNSFKLTSLLSNLWNGLQPQLPRFVAGQMEASIKEHQSIIDAILHQDGENARKHMENHIRNSETSFIKHFNNIK